MEAQMVAKTTGLKEENRQKRSLDGLLWWGQRAHQGCLVGMWWAAASRCHSILDLHDELTPRSALFSSPILAVIGSKVRHHTPVICC